MADPFADIAATNLKMHKAKRRDKQNPSDLDFSPTPSTRTHESDSWGKPPRRPKTPPGLPPQSPSVAPLGDASAHPRRWFVKAKDGETSLSPEQRQVLAHTRQVHQTIASLRAQMEPGGMGSSPAAALTPRAQVREKELARERESVIELVRKQVGNEFILDVQAPD